MAIKNRCVACDFVIEAADAMRGREVVCPKCETKNVLRSAEDAARMADVDRRQADQERRRFLEGLARTGATARPAGDGRPRSAALGEAAPDGDAARGLAALAGRRLKDVSVYLLAMAYLLLLPALAGAFLLLAGPLSPVWKAVGFLAASLLGVILFVVLKFTSDGVRALADLTDLLRAVDVRLERLEERTDRAEGGPGGLEHPAEDGAAAVPAAERSAG
jgi:hypothetical protein